MTLQHFNYVKLVKALLEQKRADGTLSALLAKPSPATIREACVNMFKEKFDPRDEAMLKVFFGPMQRGMDLFDVINNVDIEKLKPLKNYLLKKTTNTTHKNLELLAWLLEFEHRPFSTGKQVFLNAEELNIIRDNGEPHASSPERVPSVLTIPNKIQSDIVIDRSDECNQSENDEEEIMCNEKKNTEKIGAKDLIDTENEDETEEKESSQKSHHQTEVSSISGEQAKSEKPQFQKRVMSVLALLMISLVACILWQQKKFDIGLLGAGNGNCMYWANDHYEKASCDQEQAGKFLVPYNEDKFRNFKRIIRTDTITERSVGMIYCININGGVEYYTEGGQHPVDVRRSLKKLSLYMYKAHLLKNDELSDN